MVMLSYGTNSGYVNWVTDNNFVPNGGFTSKIFPKRTNKMYVFLTGIEGVFVAMLYMST